MKILPPARFGALHQVDLHETRDLPPEKRKEVTDTLVQRLGGLGVSKLSDQFVGRTFRHDGRDTVYVATGASRGQTRHEDKAVASAIRAVLADHFDTEAFDTLYSSDERSIAGKFNAYPRRKAVSVIQLDTQGNRQELIFSTDLHLKDGEYSHVQCPINDLGTKDRKKKEPNKNCE